MYHRPCIALSSLASRLGGRPPYRFLLKSAMPALPGGVRPLEPAAGLELQRCGQGSDPDIAMGQKLGARTGSWMPDRQKMRPPVAYRDAGVDIDAGNALVAAIKPLAA